MSDIFTDNFKTTPYWHDHVTIPALTNTSLPKDTDICIVGAGFTGLATALHLLRAGKSVTIFDAQKLGDGASGKNGGMIGPSLHKLGLDGLTSIYGANKAHAILQEGINAIEYFKNFIAEENIQCDLAMTGRFRGVNNQQELDSLARDCEKLSILKGFQYNLIQHQDVQSEIGSTNYYAGVTYGLDGGLHPQKLLIALTQKILDLGGQIFDQTQVTDIQTQANNHRITTSKGAFTAGQVVIATNGYSKKFGKPFLSHFYNRVMPITSAMIATQQLPAELITRLFPKARMHGGNHRLVQYYRPSPNGKRVLFGARGVDFRDRADKNAKNLKTLLNKIFPELIEVKITHSWSGKVAYTFDHVPHLGQHDGLYYAMGYCGSGVTRSLYLAKKLSMQILGEENFQTEFNSLNFQTKPFYNGTPWFLPFVIKWHSFLDRISR
ncbi:MAG: FAD-dependent oxidoreductase [Hyphomicrobiales bacterium]|nr:MAG: FAD-dependent oxidoreductase [Hyphomicrobiales bacterium]